MKSLRTRLGAALLAAVLAVSVIVPAAAAPAAFSDVPSNAWYAQDVADVQKYGIINGVGNNRFAPDGVLTFAQAITMAARTYAYINGDSIPQSQNSGDYWAIPYIDYAIDVGLVSYEDMSNNQRYFDNPCLRWYMAELFYSVISRAENTILNNIQSIPDVLNDSEGRSIYSLYRYGILTGSDQYGSFYPMRSITRAETSAILNRILDQDKRKTFTLKPGSPMYSLDLSAAWTLYEEYVYDNEYTEYYNTTIAFMSDGSMYGMYYIPDSGFSERFRGTYKLNGKNIELKGIWDDGTKYYGTYEVSASPDYWEGFALTMISGEGLYIGNDGAAVFERDYDMTAKQCKDRCQSGWGTPPQ